MVSAALVFFCWAAAAAACVFRCWLPPSFSLLTLLTLLRVVIVEKELLLWRARVPVDVDECEWEGENPGHFPSFFSVLFLANFPNFPHASCLLLRLVFVSVFLSLQIQLDVDQSWCLSLFPSRTTQIIASQSIREPFACTFRGKLDVLARIKLLAMILRLAEYDTHHHHQRSAAGGQFLCLVGLRVVVVAGEEHYSWSCTFIATTQQSSKVARLCIVGLIVKVKTMSMTVWNNRVVGSLIVGKNQFER